MADLDLPIPAQSPQRGPGRRRVRRIEHEGQGYWVKWPDQPPRLGFGNVHRVLSPVLPTPLRPTSSPAGPEALAAEAARLRQAASAGIAVPAILQQTDDYLVLEDAGTPLGPLLKQDPDPDTRQALLLSATQALGTLHKAGLVHGRPHVKDMTVRDTDTGPQIVLLDFEEDPLKVMSLPEAQARDIWLWLGSASLHAANDAALDALLQSYLSEPPDGVIQALSRLRRLMRPLQTLIIAPQMGRDIRQIHAATACLSRCADLIPG